ncbi:MAG: TetR/AcrR family transcriptional regulator [Desulfobacteraceae bacterium]|nr:MAG: TetR/AcrR family transcriptional regulator [Desulfobacteraceae bacterium]
MRKIKTNIKNPELVEKRRNQISEAAAELFRTTGYHATTMRTICKKAKVNQGSFYDYFGSKEDILVYIYKQIMSRELDWASPDGKITDLNDMERFLRALMLSAWNEDKNYIQLLYRETTSLDSKTRKEVLQLESDFVKWVAEKLREGLGWASTSLELEMIANLTVYINSFIPLRGWNLHHVDQEKILNLVIRMLMTQLKELSPQEDC